MSAATRMGAPADVLDRLSETVPAEPDSFEVWREHADALGLFCAAQDCWRHAGFSGAPVGFDWTAADIVWRRLKLKAGARIFQHCRAIAAGALDEWLKRIGEETPERANDGPRTP
jgi:hypothetical protein